MAAPKPVALIVEDDEVALRFYAVVLENHGFAVETAMTGTEAVRKAASLDPAVILLDLGLPELSGFDVLASVRRDPAKRHIPAVAVTGFGSERERAEEAGFDLFLTKPVSGSVLMLKLQELLRSRKNPIAS